MRNPAVECNVAAFSELSFAAHWQGRPSRGYSTTSNNTNLMSSGYLQQHWWTILLKRSMGVR